MGHPRESARHQGACLHPCPAARGIGTQGSAARQSRMPPEQPWAPLEQPWAPLAWPWLPPAALTRRGTGLGPGGANKVTEDENEIHQRGRRRGSSIPLSHTKRPSRLTTWLVEGNRPGQHHPVPPCPQPHTFNAADDFEAAGGEPIGDEEEDGNQGGIEQAVVVQGCPLHGSIPCARSRPPPSPATLSGTALSPQSPATPGREAGGCMGRHAGNWERRVRARLPNQLP